MNKAIHEMMLLHYVSSAPLISTIVYVCSVALPFVNLFGPEGIGFWLAKSNDPRQDVGIGD